MNTGLNKNMKTNSLINNDRLTDTFIKLTKIDSGSKEELADKRTPSTDSQKNIANILKNELEQIGLSDVDIDKNCIVTATLNSNLQKSSKTIGLIAHYDTSEAAPNSNVKPLIHSYTDGDIILKDGTVISQNDLLPYKNQKIITSDGTTLLGADDKAGIAEILEAVRVFTENPALKHPTIKIAFTPDEETGMGISKFNIKNFNADAAYTIDGGAPESVENETFNAFNPEIIIKGKTVHCGHAKNKMINSIDIACYIASQLPDDEKPQTTENRQGYYHIDSISGDVSETKMKLLVRDHEYKKAKQRIKYLKTLINKAKKIYGCEIEFKENKRYLNMKEYIDKYPEVMEYAIKGITLSGLTPKCEVIRGGTDGSELSRRGLPTPNLGAGGVNFHSKSEFLPINNLVKCCENIINIIQCWADN
ncbi:MAG: peptidase T [Candidatus Gastranaerophilales bacterium]|nr:peptidase T [Candidatus Gastranaerophilales bacterium]